MNRLYHLVPPADWPASGDHRPASLQTEGFVHFSFAEQVVGSANRHYAAASALLVVEVDPAALDVEIRVEDSYHSGTSFPHGYGPLSRSAVVSVRSLGRDAAGRWAFSPAGDAGADASPDR